MPTGPKSVLVNGGVGHLDLTFRQFNGSVQKATSTLPAGHSDYTADCPVELDPQDGNNQTSTTIPDNSGHLSFRSTSPPVLFAAGPLSNDGILDDKKRAGGQRTNQQRQIST